MKSTFFDSGIAYKNEKMILEMVASRLFKLEEEKQQRYDEYIKDVQRIFDLYKNAMQSEEKSRFKGFLESYQAKKIEKEYQEQLMNFYIRLFQHGLIPNVNEYDFSQADLINDLDNYPKIKKIKKKYDGLCDLICNYVTDENLLGNPEDNITKKDKPLILSTLETKLYKTHILNRASLIQLILATFFHIYPDSILTKKDNKNIFVKDKNDKSKHSMPKLNQDIFSKALNDFPVGDTIKFCAFKKNILISSGHSMLIKKISADQFIFFDPNTGASNPMNLPALYNHLTVWLKNNRKYNHVCFLNNTKFLAKIFKNSKQQELKSVNIPKP